MDIRKNKTLFHQHIKRFALKATASAIITLHAETAMAISCPAFITDTSLAGIVCDFDLGSSITVGSAGVVGGINMAFYTPLPPSYITIDAGGMVSNNTGIGININASLLSNGILNNGTIDSSGSGIEISNTSTVSGGIFNNGTISSTSGTGILINNASTVSGSIFNTGTIAAANVFVGITITNNSIVEGGIANSGLINADGGDGILLRSNSTINGGISNSGSIRSVSGNGITALNISNILGNVSNNGLISAGNQGISIHNGSTVSGSILNNGTISAGQNGISLFSATTVSGSISNNGIISGGQSGISISSSAIINGGISNSGIIQGDLFAINVDASSNVDHIDIIGQSARIIGAVEAPTATVNITDSAIFTSEGAYHVNLFNIGSNAHFTMANTITAAAVNNAGTLAISNSLQTIVGDYAQQPGGLFQTNVSSVSDYGQLSVTGAVDLSQNADIYVQVSQNTLLHSGDVLSNVILGNTLTGPINGFSVSGSSYIWSFIPTVNNSNTGINLTTTINPEAYQVCQGAFCQDAATTILGQVAAGNPFFSPFAALSTANALREAASQATPELTNENIQVVQLVTRSVLDTIPMWGTLRGESSGDAMLYPPGKIWIKPYGASMTQNERSTIPGFHATAYGAVIGKDIPLTSDWLFGGGFAAGGDSMHGKSVLSGQSINSQTYQGLLYGSKKLPNHIYFAGQGLVGYEINDTNRFIPLYASTAKGTYNSWFTNLSAEAGWSTFAGSPNFVFTPMVDANYLFINQGAYQESGSPLDLLIASNHNSSLVLGAYANGAYHLTNIHHQHNLTLTGYAGFAGDVIKSQPQVISTFAASGTTFSTFGVPFNGLVFRGGVGLTLTNSNSPLLVELNYNVQTGNNAHSNIGSVTIKYKT